MQTEGIFILKQLSYSITNASKRCSWCEGRHLLAMGPLRQDWSQEAPARYCQGVGAQGRRGTHSHLQAHPSPQGCCSPCCCSPCCCSPCCCPCCCSQPVSPQIKHVKLRAETIPSNLHFPLFYLLKIYFFIFKLVLSLVTLN
jgi:hypothetical protein